MSFITAGMRGDNYVILGEGKAIELTRDEAWHILCLFCVYLGIPTDDQLSEVVS